MLFGRVPPGFLRDAYWPERGDARNKEGESLSRFPATSLVSGAFFRSPTAPRAKPTSVNVVLFPVSGGVPRRPPPGTVGAGRAGGGDAGGGEDRSPPRRPRPDPRAPRPRTGGDRGRAPALRGFPLTVRFRLTPNQLLLLRNPAPLRPSKGRIRILATTTKICCPGRSTGRQRPASARPGVSLLLVNRP